VTSATLAITKSRGGVDHGVIDFRAVGQINDEQRLAVRKIAALIAAADLGPVMEDAELTE